MEGKRKIRGNDDGSEGISFTDEEGTKIERNHDGEGGESCIVSGAKLLAGILGGKYTLQNRESLASQTEAIYASFIASPLIENIEPASSLLH